MSRALDIIFLFEKTNPLEYRITLSQLIKLAKQGGKLKGYKIEKKDGEWKVFFQGKELTSDEFKFSDERALRVWLFKLLGRKAT